MNGKVKRPFTNEVDKLNDVGLCGFSFCLKLILFKDEETPNFLKVVFLNFSFQINIYTEKTHL